MSVGIYRVLNTINNKFYIGSSIDLNRRKTEHNCKSKSYRGNSIIRRAVLKYGTDCFKFEILEEFVFAEFATKKYKLELITSREQYYVDILNPYYNIHKEDVTSHKGVPMYQYINGSNQLNIDVYKKENLEFIETIKGVRKCARLYNIDCSQLTQMCKKGYTEFYQREFVFCYTGNKIIDLFRPAIKIRNHFLRKDNIPIIQIDKDSNFVREWRTGKEAEKELHLYKGAVSRVISGEYSHTKNYHFISKN